MTWRDEWESLVDLVKGTEKNTIVIKGIEYIQEIYGLAFQDSYGVGVAPYPAVWFEVGLNFEFRPLGVDMGFQQKAFYDISIGPEEDETKLLEEAISQLSTINNALSNEPYEFEDRHHPNDIDYFEKDWSKHLPDNMYDTLLFWARRHSSNLDKAA